MQQRIAVGCLTLGLIAACTASLTPAQTPTATPSSSATATSSPSLTSTSMPTCTPVPMSPGTVTASGTRTAVVSVDAAKTLSPSLTSTSTLAPTSPSTVTPSTTHTDRPSPHPTETSAPPASTPTQPTVTPTSTELAPTATEEIRTATPIPAEALRVYETTLSIPTYGYEAAFEETQPDDPIYPYPRIAMDRMTPPEPRAYRAIVIENTYVALTILPDLGGRVYRWIDKTTGRHLLYENPVIKPTGWGYRGWWLAAGGIEWAFPVEEHGLNEWRPWSYTVNQQAGSISVTVSDVEDRTGMTVGATLTLSADRADVLFEPWVRNTTDVAQSYQYWLNAMVSLGDNRVSGHTRLILPTHHVIVHSTGDATLPGTWQAMAWPSYGNRDLSLYANWTDYLGFFVPDIADGFVALYDEEADQGLVRSFTPGNPIGTKLFGPATLPPGLWTDNDSSYIELWSGVTPTFAQNTSLPAGQSRSWQERWYAVHGIGSVRSANANAALHLEETADGVRLGVAVSAATRGTLTLWIEGDAASTWELALNPGQPFQTTWPRPVGSAGAPGLTLASEDGQRLANVGTVP